MATTDRPITRVQGRTLMWGRRAIAGVQDMDRRDRHRDFGDERCDLISPTVTLRMLR